MMDEEHHCHQDISPQHRQDQKSPPKDRKSIHELRNQDFVSRLLAATPPYLYSAPVGPNNYFFSDMLRSLVQTRNNETARNLQMQQAAALARRPRKRSWSQHRPYFEHMRDRKNHIEKLPVAEKPLELTTKQLLPMNPAKLHKPEHTPKETTCNKAPTDTMAAEGQNTMQDSPTAASLPPQDLVLPPPPPVWYPPLYPPYGIDPLHFFIDLRVSGHIYDRKKENVSPLANTDSNTLTSTEVETPGKPRHGSAFTVPIPRGEAKNSTAMNLSSTQTTEAVNKLENYAKYYDLGETKENQPNSKGNAQYVLQNLPRLYSQFTGGRDLTEENSFENDSKSDQDCEESIDDYSCGASAESSAHIDVELIESGKSRVDATASRCTSPEEYNIGHLND